MSNAPRWSLVFALAFASAGLAAPAQKGDQATFRDLIDRYWQAWNSMSTDNAAKFYDQTANDVFYDLAPLKYNGWNEYRDGVQKLFASAASLKITANDDLKVTRHSNWAWTSSTFHMTETTKDGKTSEATGRHTAIWEKHGNTWLIVHEHVSVPMQ